ncbi:MAG: polysaccharide biosynthesis/export family protein [Anaerolineae bacterium]|nr:polysaccharide biosynthesis/export family protein [Phycisphaerae bacterium]
MANTENIEAKLAAYVDGELDAAGRAEIEQYLTTNPQHRLLIDELRQAKNYLQDLPRAAAPVEVAEMISQQLERASLLGDVEIGAGTGETHFARWPQVRAIAAILLLTVGLAGVLYYVLPSPKPVSPQSAIITPDLPPDDSPNSSMEMATARRAEPSVAAADSPERVEARLDATVAAPGAAPGAAPDADSREVAGAVAGSNVGRMLGGGAGGNNAAPSGALYLMINTPDPATANTQVVNYFASNRISYEQVAANDTTVAENKLYSDMNRALALPTTLPEFDNAAPSAAAPTTASNLGVATETLKDALTPSTNPADKHELAKSASPDAIQQQQSFACYKAKMTREEAANLSETLSQPQMRQVAHIVSPDFRQQQQEQVPTKGDAEDEIAHREKSQAEQQQIAGQAAAPTTNESSPTTDQILPQSSAAPAPAYAERATSRGDVLAAGDNIRIRTSDPLRAGSQPSEETQVIDEEGYVALPNVGRVKAAGLTPYQLSSSVIPQAQARNRDSQSPQVHLMFTIEKIGLESNFAPDQKFPATQESRALATDAPRAAKPEPMTGPMPGPTTGPTTHPTTNPTELTAAPTPAPSEQEKIDVVVIVRNAEGPTTAPTVPIPDMSIERRVAEPISPSTQPAITSPATVPTTYPTR